MFCSHCGTRIPDNAAFCPQCGSPTVAAQQQTQQTQQQYYAASSAPQASQQTSWQPPVPAYGAPIAADRNLFMWALLTFVTCGIYHWYFVYRLAQDMNALCEGDGEETPGLLVFIVLSLCTCGFYSYWWEYKIGNRLQRNAPRYGLLFQENGTTIILWQVVGMLLCCIGPFVAMNIIIKNTNAMATAYNARLGR